MNPKKLHCVTVFFIISFLSLNVHSQLEIGFYSISCTEAEFIVKDEVGKAFDRNPGIAAALVRMHFHDCFISGCDASVLIDSTPKNTAEKDSPANNPSLTGYEVIDNAKARLEAVCPGIVSCADIVAFAARDSFEFTGEFGYDVPAGRRDGRISLASETRKLPSPRFNVDQLTQIFAEKGLTQEEMVTLSGAHTIGHSHCSAFSHRLYNFSGTSRQDPSMDRSYAIRLKRQCPQGSTDQSLVVPMNPSSPGRADVGYYVDVLANRGLLTSDQALLTNPATKKHVSENARNTFLWIRKFSAAMVKMGQIGVITGDNGEIRRNCRVVNGLK